MQAAISKGYLGKIRRFMKCGTLLYIHAYIYIFTNIYICNNTYICIYIYECEYAYIYICIYIYVPFFIYISSRWTSLYLRARTNVPEGAYKSNSCS